jgi:nucleotide-binding universal stress UspA family protein
VPDLVVRSLPNTAMPPTIAQGFQESALYKTIVLAYDGSESGQRALLDCQEIGQWSQARLHLVAVMAPPMAMVAVDAWALSPSVASDDKAHYQSVLDAGLQRLSAAGLAAQGKVVEGYAVDEIATVAKSVNADLIVLGHKHLDSWAARWWRGASVSQSLIEIAPCSVLIVIGR